MLYCLMVCIKSVDHFTTQDTSCSVCLLERSARKTPCVERKEQVCEQKIREVDNHPIRSTVHSDKDYHLAVGLPLWTLK